MDKTIKLQRKIITILASLLIILVSYLGYWLLYERSNLNGNINELNRGAKIDYDYVNKIVETNQATYTLWESCSTTLSKDLKGEMSDSELLRFMGDYSKQVDTTMDLYEELATMKKNRSDEFSKFQYAKVYQPE